MKKIVLYILPLIMITLLVIPFIRVEKDIPIEKFDEIIQAYVKEDMEKQDMKIVKTNYKMQAGDVEALVSYGPKSYINVDEITILRQSDESKRSDILEKTKEHVDSQLKSFEGYGIEQTKLLKKAVVIEKGNYVICIILEKSKNVYDDILHMFK